MDEDFSRRVLIQILRNQQGELEIQRSIMFRERNLSLYSEEERNQVVSREEDTSSLLKELEDTAPPILRDA